MDRGLLKGILGITAILEYYGKVVLGIVLYNNGDYRGVYLLLVLGTLYEVVVFFYVTKR